MHKLLGSRQLGLFAAGAIAFFGLCLVCRRVTVASESSNATAGQVGSAYLDAVLVLMGFVLFGLLAGLALTAVQQALEFLGRTEEARARDAERWERLFRYFEQNAPLIRTDLDGRTPFPTQHEAIGDIRRAIRDGDWREAGRHLETLRADEPENPEIDRLGREVEAGRKQMIESRLEQILASKEVSDSDRVLELYQEIAPILEPSSRKPLEDDLARWFMALIQRRLRSGMIQAEVVVLSGRVAEVFGGTAEGASLRAGLSTLRRSVGLCPRCGGPYRGVDEACPACLGGSTS